MPKQVYNKWKSRTFLFALVWTAMVPLAILAQALVPTVEIPVASIVSFAGAIVVAYMGKRSVQELKRDV